MKMKSNAKSGWPETIKIFLVLWIFSHCMSARLEVSFIYQPEVTFRERKIQMKERKWGLVCIIFPKEIQSLSFAELCVLMEEYYLLMHVTLEALLYTSLLFLRHEDAYDSTARKRANVVQWLILGRILSYQFSCVSVPFETSMDPLRALNKQARCFTFLP